MSPLVLLAALGFSSPAAAAPTSADVVAAQAAYDRGKQLLAEGKYAEACPKLEESQRLDPATGTQFHLADCWEHVGRTASAWAAFLDVAAASKAAGRTDREKISRSRAAALEARLSRLTVVVSAKDTPDLQIKRDGELVRPALWDTPIPVDLGTHSITATAPGKQSWEGKAQLMADGANVSVTVPALASAPGSSAQAVVPPPPPRVVLPPPGGALPPPATEPSRPFFRQQTVGEILVAAGLIGAGVSIPLGLSAKSKFDGAKAQCSGGCDDAGARANQDAISLGNTATAVLAIGAGVAVLGGVLWLTAPRASAQKAGASHVPRVGVTPSGFVLRGSFE